MTCDLSPDPILQAFDSFRGSVIDLDQARVVSHSQLAQAGTRLAGRLKEQGLVPGDRVVLAVANGPRFYCALSGLLRAGGSPLLVHVDTPPAELARVAQRWQVRYLLTDNYAPAQLASVGTCASTVADDSWEEMTLAATQCAEPRQFPSLPGVPLHPTSGTTGQPKIAVRPGRAAIAEATNYVRTIGITAEDRILAVPPMSHAYAYGLCLMVSLVSSATVITARRFSPKVVARALSAERVSILPLVPAMLDLLLLNNGCDWSHVPRCVLTAGSPLPERTASEFGRRTGSNVRPLYGTTETGGISVAPAGGPPALGGNVGPAMERVAARLAPAGENEALPQGVGQLCIRSASMMAGYLAAGGIDDSPIRDGWLKTGDLAEIDRSGQIHLKGRETEVINVFGLKVIPSEVEEALALLPDVLESKVYAGRHPSGSQIVKAAIVAKNGLRPGTVRAHCERHLAPFKRPEVITLLDELPRSPAGKIVRDLLP